MAALQAVFGGWPWAGLQRRRRANSLQMVIFAIAIMLMLMLTVVRSSLISQWQAQLPPDVPNHFLLNLAPEQRGQLQTFFAQRDLQTETLYPMTRRSGDGAQWCGLTTLGRSGDGDRTSAA